MPFGFSVPRTSQKEHILASGSNLGKLIKGKALSFGFGDSVPGFSSELKSTDSQSLGNIEQSIIIGHWSNNSHNAAIKLSLSFSWLGAVTGKSANNSGHRDRISVESWLIESLMDDFIELGGGSAVKEGVKLG